VEAAGGEDQTPYQPQAMPDPVERRALLEAIVYVAEEPLTVEQIAEGLGLPRDLVAADLNALIESSQTPGRGVEIRKVAGGYKMFTRAEYHEPIRQFVKTLRPKLRLSLPALETLAVIAYKQPVTVPEIQAIRGVNAGGVIHTLLNHKLITTAGRKKVIGRPMQYKTTKEFLVQFGLNDLQELPSLSELEELSRQALGDGDEPAPQGEEQAAGRNHAGTAQEDSSLEAPDFDSETNGHTQDASLESLAAAAGAGLSGARLSTRREPVEEDAENEADE
jgi:segregation and condensation protein B